VKISNKIISFFSTLNQYFPHITYVASKKKVCKVASYDTNQNQKQAKLPLNINTKLVMASPFGITRQILLLLQG
jgi:hypothetical protein